MEMTTSDTDDVPEQKAKNEIDKEVDPGHIISEIKNLLVEHKDPSNKLQEYIDHVEKKIDIVNKNELNNIDKEEVKKLIEKHPYFKNPNSYSIRLITIMKYLKKKNVNVSLLDIDLLVEKIILSIDGVVKEGYGKYSRKK
ncbi:hypothetical protein [Helicovermis profundi]|uniref:Uncharacterized protein n=1 Tax=Helicovermis profundi TaxID=3065157 RepID=A0AAU9ENJ4_9FIRM|nr:hypothetical protein HLPR_20300 [Clostridia bacterium S502]